MSRFPVGQPDIAGTVENVLGSDSATGNRQRIAHVAEPDVPTPNGTLSEGNHQSAARRPRTWTREPTPAAQPIL